MLAWIDLKNEEQTKWAKRYIAAKTLIKESQLKGEMEWVEAIERDCELCDKEISSFIKPMRAAWRKHVSRERRKRDFSPEGKGRHEFIINQKSYEKLLLLSKSKGVTMSRMIEMMLEEKEVQLEIDTK